MRAAGLGAELKREPETMGRGAVPREGPMEEAEESRSGSAEGLERARLELKGQVGSGS